MALTGRTLFDLREFKDFLCTWDIPAEPILHVVGGTSNSVCDGRFVDANTYENMELRERGWDGKSFLPYDTKFDLSARVAVKKHGNGKTKSQAKCMNSITKNHIMRLNTGMVVSTGTRRALVAFVSIIADAVAMDLYRFTARTPPFIVACFRVVNEPFNANFEDHGICRTALECVPSREFDISFYNGKFPGVFVRIPNMKASATIFATGSMIAAGLPKPLMHKFVNKITGFIASHPEIHAPLSKEDIAKRESGPAKRQRKKKILDPFELRQPCSLATGTPSQ
jgi:hypothetical protein